MTVRGVGICSAYIFLRRREPGAGDEVEADISQPSGAKLSDRRAQALGLSASGNFGSGHAGLGNMRASAFERTSHEREAALTVYPGNITGSPAKTPKASSW